MTLSQLRDTFFSTVCQLCDKTPKAGLTDAELTLESGATLPTRICARHKAGVRYKGQKVTSIKRKGVNVRLDPVHPIFVKS